jgi:hypothetical protein
MRRLRFHARPVTWMIAAGVGVAIAARHVVRRGKDGQAEERRARQDRRAGVDRRSPDGAPPGEERRTGADRRSGADRRDRPE